MLHHALFFRFSGGAASRTGDFTLTSNFSVYYRKIVGFRPLTPIDRTDILDGADWP
jgi:hypothetical protein